MVYPQILSKIFLKLKLTNIMLVRRQYFPQEIAKQLDMVYRPSVIYVQKFGTLH